jgi:integrase/recombinase XerD
MLSYRRDLRRYVEYLLAGGHTDLASVNEAVVAEFVATLRAGGPDRPPVSASTAARALVTVRGLHRFAAREGMLADDVTRAVHAPVLPRRLPKAISVDDVERLLKAAALGEGPLALRDTALLELLYSTGARISEAVGLHVDDVDREERAVILHGKGGKERIVPVGSYALVALEAYLVRGRAALAAKGGRAGSAGPRGGRSGTSALFLNARGGPLSRQSAWTILNTAAERAGITSGVSPHTLRHSFATHLLDGGADVRVVQELLGHASVTTTQIYTLVTVDQLREVYATAHPRAR